MIDETQGPGSELPEAGQETSLGGASEWNTVPPSSAPVPPTPALEPLPQPASSASTSAPTGPPVPPSAPAPIAQQSYQPVYGTGQQAPPNVYASGPGGGFQPPTQTPPGYTGAGGPPPGYPPPPPAAGQGLSSNAAAAISYITFIPAVVFLVMAPYNRDRFVRFHAWQSIALWIVLIAVHIVFDVLGVAGFHFLMWGLHMLVDLVLFIAWLIAIIKASQGQWFKIPVIGDLAQNFAGKDA